MMNDKDFTDIVNKMLEEHRMILEMMEKKVEAQHLSSNKKSTSDLIKRIANIADKMDEQTDRYKRLISNEPVMKLIRNY